MKKILILLVVFLLGGSGELRATVVLPLSLQTMADESERIFLGKVLAVESDLDEHHIPASLIRFQVLEGIKGTVSGEQVLIKQFDGLAGAGIAGSARHALRDGSVLLTPKSLRQSAHSFAVGEEVVVFLYPESRLGFTSPVGYGQGCFEVTDIAGTKTVSNGWHNHFLQIPTSRLRALSLPDQGGPDRDGIELKSFLQVVREMQ